MAIKLTPEQNALAAKLFAVDAPEYPASLGGCIDQLYKLREDRLELENRVKELKKDEEALRQHIFEKFGEADVDGAKGKIASAGIVRSTVAHITDFETACNWIARRKAWDLLYRRIADPAYRERIDAGIVVAGVEPFPVTKLSVTKVGGKK